MRALCNAGGEEDALLLASAQSGVKAFTKLEAIHALHSVFGVGTIFIGFEPPVGVRVSPHQDNLFHRERQFTSGALRQMTDPPRPFPGRQLSQQTALKKNLSGL